MLRVMQRDPSVFGKKQALWVDFTYNVDSKKYGKTMLGRYIRYVRKMRKLTLREVAKMSKIDYSIITNIEIGRTKKPSLVHVYKICKALEVDLNTLLKVLEQDYA